MLKNVLIILFTSALFSQPYIEPIMVRHSNAFRNNSFDNSPINTLEISSELPFKINQNSYFYLNPYYCNHHINLDNPNQEFSNVQSLRLPFGLISPIGDSKWSFTFLSILSSNSQTLFSDNSLQIGSVFFTSYSKNPKKKIQFGVYANKEFFGWFVIPLAGLNWQINPRNYLFGMLPGRLTYEHQLNPKTNIGINFRSPLNSYRINNQQYITVYDNQLSVFLDYYLTKPICISVETGYGLFRKIRTTTIVDNIKTNDTDRIDGSFIKLSAAYRIKTP